MDRPTVRLIVNLLAVLGFWSALICLFVPFFYFFFISSGAASAGTFTLADKIWIYARLIYVYAMVIVDLFLAIGFLKRSDKARVLALILSPVPFIGTLLFFSVYPYGVNIVLQCTGISFPSLLLIRFGGVFNAFNSANLIILLGICNLAMFFFLRSNSVRSYFQEKTTQNHSTQRALQRKINNHSYRYS